MKNIGALLLLGVFAVTPAIAQDETYDDAGAEQYEEVVDEAGAAEETAVDDAALSEEVPSDGSDLAESADAEAAETAEPVEESYAEESYDAAAEGGDDVAAEEGVEAAVEEVAAEEVIEEPVSDREPWEVYVGADRAWLRASFSDAALKTRFGGDEFESDFYRVRAGVRVFGAVGLELHYGISDDDGAEPQHAEVASYWGAYAVPTGTLFNLIELSAPIGYSRTELERGIAKETFDGISFGLNFEIPLILDASWFPDVRIGGGGTVYQAEKDARVYGYHAGIRIDFKL
jgi:hypothetical protein